MTTAAAATFVRMLRTFGLIGVLLLGASLLAGCSARPTTFTIEGTWQFPSTEPDPMFDQPCKYPSGPIVVSDDTARVLGTGHVTSTDFGDVGGYAVCNVQFSIKGVPLNTRHFRFAVPGYTDPKAYTREELDYLEIKSPRAGQ